MAVRTRYIDDPVFVVEHVPHRQPPRFRRVRGADGKWSRVLVRSTLKMVPVLRSVSIDTGKYMPHIGKKERGRYKHLLHADRVDAALGRA